MEKKTECEIVQDLLLGYVDGVLKEESKKLVEKHLLTCKECQKKLNEIKKDMQENENNQKKEIDYLKKIRRKSRIKSILIAIGIILILCFVLYLYKFVIVNSFISKAEKTLKTNNLYKETIQMMGDNQTSVTKTYYKDGKYKSVWEMYSDNGVEVYNIQYASVDAEERIVINEKEKKVTKETGKFTKMMNQEENLKSAPFVQNRNSLLLKLGTAFYMSITTDNYKIGREYYVLRNQFEPNQRWEIWIDKETGLPLKEVNKEGVETRFIGTDIVKEVRDNTQEYQYEFGIVTDEDVEIPDLSGYQIEYVNTDTLFEQ